MQYIASLLIIIISITGSLDKLDNSELYFLFNTFSYTLTKLSLDWSVQYYPDVGFYL